MNNFLKFLYACAFIALLIKVFPQTTPVAGYQTKTISADTVNYLKTSAQYSPYYNGNKKFAVYYTGMDCPHGQAFASAMNEIAANSNYQQNYNFSVTNISGNSLQKTFSSMQEAKMDGKFMDLCQQFCIVNPKTGGIYSLSTADERTAAELTTLFNRLQNW